MIGSRKRMQNGAPSSSYKSFIPGADADEFETSKEILG